MTVHRVIGTEVEYGISVPGDPGANPMLTSTLLVNAYAQLSPSDRRTRWDYEEEQPLRDARGFDLSRGLADPSQLTDEDPGMANVVLTNGARLYVDHAHPEFSTPEVVTPLDAVRWERAGQAVMRDAARRVAATGGPQLLLYKNNVDNKGASYGTHENYLMARSTPFAEIVRHLTPFFVSRQVVCGSGRVGIGQDGRGHGFQLSQRADYMETEVGLETTLKRPIINTRDEPHADAERWRRLHVIIGDANLSEVSTYLKIGTTALVLAMIEAGSLSDDVTLLDPVPSVHAVSHDPGLGHLLQLADGRRMTALDLQEHYLTQARTHVARHGGGPDERSAAQTEDVLARWESVLTRLRRDPMECARELDWVAKLQLLEQYRDRDGLGWDHPQLHLIDLQYSDIRPEKGLHARLEARGRIERLTAETEVEEAMHHPPIETRAWFRGQCLERYADQIAAASWDAVVFDVPGDSSLHRVPTMDPYRGSRAHVGDLLDRCPDPASLLRELAV